MSIVGVPPFMTPGLWRCLLLTPLLLLSMAVGGAEKTGAGAAVSAQAERAIIAVKALQAKGEIRPGAILRLRVKQGNLAAFLGQDFEIQREWERLTGIPIDANLMPQADSREFIARSQQVDLTIARTHEFPDLFHDGLIEDLTPLAERFGFRLDDAPPTGYFLLAQQAYLGKRLVAIPADADVPLLYVRRDLLEDAGNRERFRARYGYQLAAPRSWDEYRDQIAFFDRAREGFFGSLEQRERDTAWMFWIQRYVSMSPTPRLFGERMRPLIDSPAGIAATENYMATVAYSPPAVLDEGKDYSYTLPFFANGKGYATIITPAGAKVFGMATSPVREQFLTVPLPGATSKDKGKLLRREVLIYGNNLVIPRRAENKTLAFLFAMWLSDPSVSTRSVGVPGGFTDPYRYHHLDDARIEGVYSSGALKAIRESLPNVLPAGTGVPGNAEYLAALNQELWRAAAGRQTAREAMKRAAQAWEEITERRGRTAQQELYRSFTDPYPALHLKR